MGLKKAQTYDYFRDQNTTFQEKFNADSHIKIPETGFWYLIVITIILLPVGVYS